MRGMAKPSPLLAIAFIALLALVFGPIQFIVPSANAQQKDPGRLSPEDTDARLTPAADTAEQSGNRQFKGLQFEGVRYSWTNAGGQNVLEVRGSVRNTSSNALSIPTVIIVLRDENGEVISETPTEVSVTELGPDEAAPFLKQILSPPTNVRNLTVRFASGSSEGVEREIWSLIEQFYALFNQGRYAEAETLAKRTLVMAEKALGPQHLLVGKVLNDLALLYAEDGREQDAEPLAKRSVAILEAKPGHPITAWSLDTLAWIYTQQERYAEAEELHKRAKNIIEKLVGNNHPDFAGFLTSLGENYRRQGREKEAEELFKQAIAIYETTGDYGELTVPLANLAAIYFKQKRETEALALAQRSLTKAQEIFGARHPWTALLQNALAYLYAELRRYEDALTMVNTNIDQGVAAHYGTFRALSDARRSKLISEDQSFAASYKVLQAGSRSAAADAVEKLAERFAAGTDKLAEIVRQDQDLKAESEKIDKDLLAAFSKDPGKRNRVAEESLQNRRTEIESQRKRLADILIEQFPDYVALANPQPLTLQETQKMLADDEAVVAFSLPRWPRKIPAQEKGYVWVVTKTEAGWIELPTNAEDLASDIAKLRSSLTFKRNEPFDASLAHKVYAQTFGPIATKLKGKTRLSILADGALTSIPFDLLIISDPQGKPLKDADWLINTYAITVIPSIFSLKTMRAEKASSEAKKPMIAFADPVFSRDDREDAERQSIAMESLPSFYRGVQLDMRALAGALPQLPGTRIEVEKIAENLQVPEADLNFGQKATETAVKESKLDDYRIVYFATHGLVAGEFEKFGKAKAEPALALTTPGRPSDLDNGLLEASEVAGLKLDADWVVLSACNTASSDGVGAEPLSGLASAFIYAGGRSLVVSHWDVADEATAQLMSDLFVVSKEKSHLSHGEIMRQAKLGLLEAATTDREAHPRFWAPFVVVGEPAVKGAPTTQLGGVAPQHSHQTRMKTGSVANAEMQAPAAAQSGPPGLSYVEGAKTNEQPTGYTGESVSSMLSMATPLAPAAVPVAPSATQAQVEQEEVETASKDTGDLPPVADDGSTRYGIAIGSVAKRGELRPLWQDYLSNQPAIVAGLQPRRVRAPDNRWRLIAGPFANVQDAEGACSLLKRADRPCAVTVYAGHAL